MSLPITALPRHDDSRGSLVVAQPPHDVPFPISRVFWIFAATPRHARAGHAARTQSEFLVCVAGSCRVTLRDVAGARTGVLDRPDEGLLVGPRTWIDLTELSDDCVLLVLCDSPYDPDDAIGDPAEFEQLLT